MLERKQRLKPLNFEARSEANSIRTKHIALKLVWNNCFQRRHGSKTANTQFEVNSFANQKLKIKKKFGPTP